MTASWAKVGRVTRPHGIRGELRVTINGVGKDFPDIPEVLLSQDEKQSQIFQIESVRPTNKAWLLKLKGMDNRNEAELWANAILEVDIQHLPKLAAGEFYLFEVIGAKVLDANDQTSIGMAQGWIDNKGQDVLVIDKPNGELLLPLTPHTVVEFRRAERVLLVNPIPGLWE